MWTQHTLMLLSLAVQGTGVVGARTKLLTSLKNAHLDSSNQSQQKIRTRPMQDRFMKFPSYYDGSKEVARCAVKLII